jgi:hypothetical protein
MTSDDSPTLYKVMSSVAARMNADFAASGAALHRGSKGTVREAYLVDNYLRKYMPRSVVVEHSGEIVAADGQVSGQCDILILGPSTPPFWDEGNYRIVPVECLYGVIEVKSYLSTDELAESWRKTAKLKAFPKSAFREQWLGKRTRSVYGKEWDYVPTSGMVFAYDGADIGTLAKTFVELSKDQAPEQSIDSVWVLNRGFICWTNPENGFVDPGPEPGSGVVAIDATPQQVLMSLTMAVHEHYGTAWMPPFNLQAYLSEGELGTVKQHWTPDLSEPPLDAAPAGEQVPAPASDGTETPGGSGA